MRKIKYLEMTRVQDRKSLEEYAGKTASLLVEESKLSGEE